MILFFLLLMLFLNMLMYDLFQAVSILFMKPRCFSLIRKCGKRLVLKKRADLILISQTKKLSHLFLLVWPGWFIFGKVFICRHQPLHCRLLMVNACQKDPQGDLLHHRMKRDFQHFGIQGCMPQHVMVSNHKKGSQKKSIPILLL